ncbi:MAG: replicative DNA helicase [Pirellulales bacterium]
MVVATKGSKPAVTSEILDRLPPQNLDAEKGVLGSILLDPEVCDDVAMLLRPDDFYSDAHQKLYAHLQTMHSEGKRIDSTLLVERLNKAGELDAIGGLAYLAEVVEAVPFASHAVYYAQIVQDKATLRSLIHANTEILRDCFDPSLEPRDLLGRAEEKILSIHDKRQTAEVADIKDVLFAAFDQINARLDPNASSNCVASGFTDLDHMMGGLHNGELLILAARPSMGKTALAANIAEHVSLEVGAATLFVSLEMSRAELGLRMLCSHGKVDAHKVRNGFVSALDQRKLVEASNRLNQAKLYIDDSPSRTMTEIAAAARRLKRKNGDRLGLIVIDYLQLIEPDNARDPRQEQVARIARRLKGLARELHVPIMCLAQLNRQAESGKEGSRPRLSHLRESGAIEQDADVVMFVHREAYYQQNEEEKAQLANDAELIIAKQRNGPVGDVKLVWQSAYTRFENLDHKHAAVAEAF